MSWWGLAVVVNALLDRLETSFEQQRRFMADASHELRTPTAIIRTEAEVTLTRDRGEDEYRSSVTVMRDAARRLTRIVDDLFLLARADSGHLVARRDALYLEELLHDAVRSVRQVAEQRGVVVKLGSIIEAPFEGDADLLGRLFLNLLDNAIKYSPKGRRRRGGDAPRRGSILYRNHRCRPGDSGRRAGEGVRAVFPGRCRACSRRIHRELRRGPGPRHRSADRRAAWRGTYARGVSSGSDQVSGDAPRNLTLIYFVTTPTRMDRAVMR